MCMVWYIWKNSVLLKKQLYKQTTFYKYSSFFFFFSTFLQVVVLLCVQVVSPIFEKLTRRFFWETQVFIVFFVNVNILLFI